MHVFELEAKSCPAVLKYALAADGRHGPPEVEAIKKPGGQGEPADAIVLMAVSGTLDNDASLNRAVKLSSRYAEAGLRVAFCERAPDGNLDAVLLDAFDAISHINCADAAAAARHLSRTLLMPAHATQWIGCDWRGLRDLVKRSKSGCVVYGFSSTIHKDNTVMAANATYATAIDQIERQKGSLGDAIAVCLALISGAPDLAVTEAMALVTHLRSTLSPTATIYLSMGCDESLPVEQLDVNLFAFAAPDSVEIAATDSVQ
jgi:hypothetical protein